MALDRYGRITNERIQAWLRTRTDEANRSGDTIFAEVCETLRSEAESAFDAGLNPWDSDWIQMRNAENIAPVVPLEPAPPPLDDPNAPPPPPEE